MEISFGELVRRDAQTHKHDLISAFSDVIDSGRFIGGVEIDKFIESVREMTGFKYVVPAASGTHALEAAYVALKDRANGKAIMPAMSFVATATAALRVGYDVAYLDVNEYGIIHDVTESLKRRPDRVILVKVDLWGNHASDVDIGDMPYIIDAAQSFGRTNWPHDDPLFMGAAFSFYPTKTLGALGDAGAFGTDNFAMYCEIKEYLDHGRDDNDNVGVGTTGRMDSIQAAFINVKLKGFERRMIERRLIGAIWSKCAGDYAMTRDGEFYVFVIDACMERQRIEEHFMKLGIQTGRYYDRLMPGAKKTENPYALGISTNYVAIPISDLLHTEEISYVGAALTRVKEILDG